MNKAQLSMERLEDRIALSANYFISPTGSDSNAGTLASPFATMQRGINLASAGDTISMLAGTYMPDGSTFVSGKIGTAQAPIRLEAYQGAEVIVDGGNISADPSNNAHGIRIISGTRYFEVEGLRLTNMPNGGIDVNGAHYVTLTNGETDHNGQKAGWAGSGIHLSNSTSFTTVENWDSHHNISAYPASNGTIYGNADGYRIAVSGTGNKIINSRSWRNSDDGLDVYSSTGAVTITGNWVFENGFLDEDGQPAVTPSGGDGAPSNYQGNGYGLKLGGGVSASQASNANHLVTNNVVWRNREGGVADNSFDGPLTVFNNTSYNNGAATNNFSFDFSFWDNDSTYKATVRNNLEFSTIGVPMNMNGADDQFNNWNLSVNETTADFVSLDDSANRGQRQADGSLPVSNFLHLVEGSDLLDKGIDVGLPFNGSAPDLGAFELSVEPPSADFDGNNIVDGGDFLAWQRGFGTPGAAKSDGDADNDSDVDGDDMGVWQGQFGSVFSSAKTVSAGLATQLAVAQTVPFESVLAVSESLSAELVDLAIASSLFQDETLPSIVGSDRFTTAREAAMALDEVLLKTSLPRFSNNELATYGDGLPDRGVLRSLVGRDDAETASAELEGLENASNELLAGSIDRI